MNKVITEKMVNEQKLKGFGGWLLLPLIGLFLGAALYLVVIILGIILLSLEFSITNLVSLIGFILMLSITIFVLILFLKKKSKTPSYYIGLIWLGTIIGLINLILSGGAFGSFVWSVIGAIIWTAYFMKSRRVKNTFIN
tara:strand:+ start:2216 stop:2632 length:417 start_codon:yes stop_codon:yes gene_type:complete